METESTSTSSAAPASDADSVPRRIGALGERYLSVATAVAVLRRVPEKQFDERPYQRLGFRIEEHLAEIRRMKAGAGGISLVVEALTARIIEAEALLISLDESVTPAALEALFEASPGPEDSLRYAAFLARAFTGEPERCDKISRLLIRALSFEERGVRKIRPWHLAEPALWYVVGGVSRATDSTRASAISFFHGAMKRVEAFRDVDAVFSSGFVLDVRGYKTAIREALLDPDVLYASVELEFAFLARLFQLAEQSRRSRVTVLARLAEEAKKADNVLASSGPEDAESIAERFEKSTESQRRIVLADVAPATMGKGARKGLLAGLAIFLLLSFVAVRKMTQPQQVLSVPVSATQLAELSPVLEGGSISGTGEDSLFSGAVAGSWAKLSASDKRKEAEALSSRLRKAKIRNAMVYSGDKVAIRISRGKVLLAQ